MRMRMSKRKEEDMSSDHPDGRRGRQNGYLSGVGARCRGPSLLRLQGRCRRRRRKSARPPPRPDPRFPPRYVLRRGAIEAGALLDRRRRRRHDHLLRPHTRGPPVPAGPPPNVRQARARPDLARPEAILLLTRYRVDPDANYEPWFEYLSVGEDGPGSAFWLDLPPPPFPPFVLTPRQYLDPPEIRVVAYAAVGSYIVLSLEPGGTFAFHVRNVTWAKVDNNSLPFVGDAVHLGGNHFASRSKADCGATAVFYLEVYDATRSEPARLSVVNCKVASQDIIPGLGQQLFCAPGLAAGGSFCSVDLMSSRPSSTQPGMLKNAQVVITACQMKIEEKTAELQLLANDKQSQIYQFCDRTRFLASPMPLVAVLSMDRRNIEEKSRKKKAAPHIIGAPMFTIEV
ncbi:hypothetical protein ACQ4PT_055083 [Festuca glaucescens]